MFQTIKDVAERPYLGMIVHKSGRSSGHAGDSSMASISLRRSHIAMESYGSSKNRSTSRPPQTDFRSASPEIRVRCGSRTTQDRGLSGRGTPFRGRPAALGLRRICARQPHERRQERLNFSFRPLFLEIRDDDVILTAKLADQPKAPACNPSASIVGGTLTGSGGQPDPLVLSQPASSAG